MKPVSEDVSTAAACRTTMAQRMEREQPEPPEVRCPDCPGTALGCSPACAYRAQQLRGRDDV